jgi:hypothetical protein
MPGLRSPLRELDDPGVTACLTVTMWLEGAVGVDQRRVDHGGSSPRSCSEAPPVLPGR